MKRRIIKVTASQKMKVNELIDNIPDSEFSKMSKAEKRIISKAKLSPHPDVYLAGAADAIELTGASVTDAFIDFYNDVIQNWNFDSDEVTSATDTNVELPKGYPLQYDTEREQFYSDYDGHLLYHDNQEQLAMVVNELNAHPEKLPEYAGIYGADIHASSDNRSRVVAIQVDVELPPGVDSDVVIDDIYNAASDRVQEYHIAACEICGDLTTQYEDQYPDLLVYRNE